MVGVGENSVDLLVRLPARPEFGPGEKMPIESQTLAVGGQVVTALCTCASLGLRTAYVGVFGDDEHGRFARRELEQRGVDTSASFVAAGAYPAGRDPRLPAGRALVLWSRDPGLALGPGDVPAELLQQSRVVHVDGVDADAAIRSATLARQAAPSSPATSTPPIRPRRRARSRDPPDRGRDVAAALTGQADVERVRQLRRQHAESICVTLGARRADARRRRPALRPVSRRERRRHDRRGDVFRGAYLTALLEGSRPEAFLRFATATTAISCTRVGAVAGVPTRAEIEGMLGTSS